MGLKLFARNPHEYSDTVTAVCIPDGYDSDSYIAHAQKHLDMSLGKGLGKVKGKIFRIGHLGSLNEMELPVLKCRSRVLESMYLSVLASQRRRATFWRRRQRINETK